MPPAAAIIPASSCRWPNRTILCWQRTLAPDPDPDDYELSG